MNPKIGNIVVKDIDDGKIYCFSLAKAHQKNKCLGVKWKHLQIFSLLGAGGGGGDPPKKREK